METAMTRKCGSVVDPVCGMAVDPNAAAGTASFRGQAYRVRLECFEAYRRAEPCGMAIPPPLPGFGSCAPATNRFVTGVVYAVAYNLLGPRSAARS